MLKKDAGWVSGVWVSKWIPWLFIYGLILQKGQVSKMLHPNKNHIDTQHDELEKMYPLSKKGYFRYFHASFRGKKIHVLLP